MSTAKRAEENHSTTKIAAVVTAYFVVSISMVFLNKLLIQDFKAPFFVTWIQCIVTAFVCWLCGELGQNFATFSSFPVQSYNWTTGRQLLKLALVFVGMVTLNNLCLQYVEVSFYNVARSLTIVFNVIFTLVILRQSTSLAVCGTLVIVVAGFFVGSDGEVNFSLRGTLAGVGSSVFVSLNGIYTKESLPLVNKNDWCLSFYTNATASLLFIPLILLIEVDILASYAAKFSSPGFWAMMIMSGVLGFLINIVSIAQINVTSPLTHNISGTVKACVQTLLALVIWQNETTAQAMIGVFLVIGGSMMYAWVRHNENLASQAASSGPRYTPVATDPAAAPKTGGGTETAAIDMAPIDSSAANNTRRS